VDIPIQLLSKYGLRLGSYEDQTRLSYSAKDKLVGQNIRERGDTYIFVIIEHSLNCQRRVASAKLYVYGWIARAKLVQEFMQKTVTGSDRAENA
jgi:hypothetical protein